MAHEQLPHSDERHGAATGAPPAQLRRSLFRLATTTGGACITIGVFLSLGAFPDAPERLHDLARTATSTGAAGLALGTLGLALTGELACLAMLHARRPTPGSEPQPAGRRQWRLDIAAPLLRFADPGDAARRQQGALVPLLAAAAAALAWGLRPRLAVPAPDDALIVTVALLVAAFPMLVAERTAAALRATALPEAAALRALLLLPALGLPLAAATVMASGLGLTSADWITRLGGLLVALIAAELALRALGRWFLPPPAPPAARAAIASLLAALLAGSFGREGIGGPLRTQLGLDFGRSWALLYLRAAALPALLLTALLCWGLSGVVAIGLDQRGVYERFGAPVAVLQPGLRFILPWPLGRVRRVEFGTIHELALGDADTAATPDTTSAEAQPPSSANRLWDQPHPGEVAYLIASESQGQQGFQTVSADVRVIWRFGLDDADARRAVYGITNPQTLIRAAADRSFARFFAVRTLDAVLDERRETIAATLLAALRADLAPLASGIEILDVVIEAVHPPVGAASAYHAVQAAAIEARSSVAHEQGRARATANQAQQEAHQLETSAQADAAETVQSAQAAALRFDADRAADAAGGPAFLLERYFTDLATALTAVPLTIVDNRLDAATAPIIDLRPLTAQLAPTPEEPH